MDVDSLIIEKQKNRKISEHLFGKVVLIIHN